MSSRTLARKVESKFQNDINIIKKRFGSVEFISTTADIWTSNSRRFIGMTAHWVCVIFFIYLHWVR